MKLSKNFNYYQEAHRSRDINKLHPYLKRIVEIAFKRWAEAYPDLAQPKLDCTLRSLEGQQWLYQQGADVTDVGPGWSLHNGPLEGKPWHGHSFAFDVFFLNKDGKPDWNTDLYRMLWELDLNGQGASMSQDPALAWGGDWGWDYPHFQFAVRARHMRNGIVPSTVIMWEEAQGYEY